MLRMVRSSTSFVALAEGEEEGAVASTDWQVRPARLPICRPIPILDRRTFTYVFSALRIPVPASAGALPKVLARQYRGAIRCRRFAQYPVVSARRSKGKG